MKKLMLLPMLALMAAAAFAQEKPRAGKVPANMVLVEGGTFLMGSITGGSDEKPVHAVTVKSFYMGKTEVSQKEWRELMGTTIQQQWTQAGNSGDPARGAGDNYPMYCVSWHEAAEYCNKLSLKEGLTPAYQRSGNTMVCDFNATGYRLPTEAEWEYAARGGNKDPIVYEYAGGNSVDSVAWYNGNSDRSTHPVGIKQPNSLGLYDMSGNVWEWCGDWYESYRSESHTNPTGASSGNGRVYRGGGWYNNAANVRSTVRNFRMPSNRLSDLGIRLVRPSV